LEFSRKFALNVKSRMSDHCHAGGVSLIQQDKPYPTGKTPRMLSISRRKNIPLYRNSEMSYVSAIPAHQEGRSRVVTFRELGCGGRGSVVRERCGQGG
jgi:hypothetical protein